MLATNRLRHYKLCITAAFVNPLYFTCIGIPAAQKLQLLVHEFCVRSS